MEQQTDQPKEQKVAEEYLSSLADLNLNSKPLINMLTILAEENMEHAAVIVKVVEQHISKVNSDVKLPVLYLLDSIVKNVGGEYIQLFSNCIVNIFCGVFEKVNEKVREKMYILRQTWNDVFTPQKLYTLDVKVNCMDPNWPITAKVVPKSPAIHVNPKFLQNDVDPSDMQAKLQAKQRHLLELQKRKLELELAATKQRLEEQEKQLNFQNDTNPRQPAGAVAVGPIQIGSGGPTKPPANLLHCQRNMFGSQPKNQDIGNHFPNYHGQSQHNVPPSHRPPISSGNPIMMNSVNKRDPRLARQQMSNHKQMDIKKLCENQSMQSDGIDNSIHPPGTYEERENVMKSENNRSNLNNKLKSRSGGGSNILNKQRSSSMTSNRKEYNKNTHGNDGKMSSRSSDRSSNRNGSSKSSTGSPSKYEKDRSSRRRDKMDSTKRTQSSKDSLSKNREDKLSSTAVSKSSNFGNSSTKGGSISPKSLSRHQSRRNKDATKSPSPVKQDDKYICSENNDLPTDKRIKLSSTTDSSNKLIKKSNSPNSSNSTSTTSTITTTTEKLDQNKEGESSCKDIDLRAFETRITTTTANGETVKTEDDALVGGNSPGKMVTTQSLIDRADAIRTNKKRTSVDTKQDEQPIIKKTKQEKIDTLFGSEDVDLRTEIPTLGVGGLIAPPPPNISIENESWDKVKGTGKSVNRKISPVKSSLEDVRAKLAKAAKNNNYNFGKVRKNLTAKLLMNGVQDESQDATDENIRTIISQAQELLVADNINAEQYHTLVKTVIQINETSKLKEAQRLESLLDNNNVKSLDSPSPPTESAAYKPKEQRKRIPRIPKNDKLNNDITELKGLESQIPPPSSGGQTSSYSDVPPGREEKEIKRKRQKESKWSSALPWEQQQKNAVVSQKSWMQSNTRSTSQSNQSYPANNIKGGSVQTSVTPARAGAGNGIPSPWQNPPAIIFANPLQQMHAASQLTPATTMAPSIASHHFSNSVDNPQADLVRTIPIDGVAKEIRVYDDVAIVFMDWDQPREIGFQNGQRRLIIDDQEPMALSFNDDFKTITINGSVHRIKFGFPSRELYIDNNWYECYFGGPPLSIPLDGQIHIIKIEGPPPQVNIGILRQDLVAGKINLIVDAHIIIPVFLDAKPQTFELNQSKHVIQFADQLTTVLIDNEPIIVEFGGLPKSVNLGDKKYFIRFGTLPNGIVPGRINIKNMIYNKMKRIEEQVEYSAIIPVSTAAAADGGNTDDIDMKDLTTKLAISGSNMNVGNSTTTTPKNEPMFTTSESIKQTTNSVAPLPALGNVNIDELFQKLIASGILNNQPNAQNKIEEEKSSISTTLPIKKDPIVTPIDLSKPETVKTRQAGIVLKLFCGMQCSSCGLRFPPEQTMKYSQHLDWHFRQNRRDRDSTRKAHSRKWFYDLPDWIQYEEIEDIEDREKNWFESQQSDLDNLDDNSNQRLNSPPPSCPAGPDDVDRVCDVCHEKFEQFYNEELEEWHLRSAVRVEEQLYHPVCYHDFKSSLNPRKEESPPPNDENNDNYDDDSVIIVKQEKAEANGESVASECFDDDDVIEVPMEEPSITEILDEDDDDAVEIPIVPELPLDDKDDKNVTDETTTVDSEEKPENKDLSMEDDLMIQEPNIPFTDLDTYVERDPEELNSENSTSQSQFNNIKIKEEPKDVDEEEEEEDAFEDVGTFSVVEVVQDSSDQIMETTIPDVDDSNSIHIIENENDDSASIIADAEKSLVSMDGNINITDLSSSSTIGVNKIRINITKNVISNNINNIDERNKSDSSVSTIPVITTTTNSSSSSIKQLFNNSSNLDKNDSNSNKSDSNSNKSDKTATIITTNTTTLTETTKNIDDLLVKSSNSSTNNKPTIEFSYKTELENIVFNKVPQIESGFETSGLCSIM